MDDDVIGVSNLFLTFIFSLSCLCFCLGDSLCHKEKALNYIRRDLQFLRRNIDLFSDSCEKLEYCLRLRRVAIDTVH